MTHIFHYIDEILIFLFRIIEIPVLGYYLGTFLICVLCVVAGRFTLKLSSRINERFLSRDHKDMVHMHNLSMYALINKNKPAYSNCNNQANEAFGKVFFSSVALGASSLWPVPFALAWMQYRFGQVSFELPFELPFIGSHAGFMFTFFPILVAAFMITGRAFSIFNRGVAAESALMRGNRGEELLSLRDISSEIRASI